MGFDQAAVRRLPKGLGGNRRKRSIDRAAVLMKCRETDAELFERVNADLAKALAFDDHPVVVPTR